jgi:hypothetical protein
MEVMERRRQWPVVEIILVVLLVMLWMVVVVLMLVLAVITQWTLMEVTMITQRPVMEAAHGPAIVLRPVAPLKMMWGMSLVHTLLFDQQVVT